MDLAEMLLTLLLLKQLILYPSQRACVFEYQVMDGSQAVVKREQRALRYLKRC